MSFYFLVWMKSEVMMTRMEVPVLGKHPFFDSHVS